ncbi:putative BNR repeat-like domain protein [Burkholderiales bacterium]|nr:putative BNR repeat-like domain protein [Burkholderiales bacterium]
MTGSSGCRKIPLVRTSPISLPARATALLASALLDAACGGSSSSSAPAVRASLTQVSFASALSASCGTAPGIAGAAFTPNSAVQPQLAAGPAVQLFGLWEQDRWNAVGARAIEFARSADGGSSWSSGQPLPFSACGASAGVGAGYDRASDPSISVTSGGGSSLILASALAFSAGGYLGSGGTSAVLVTRSLDGGSTWQAPVAVIADTGSGSGSGPFYFNDRDAIAADPNSGHVYLVWDRLSSDPTAAMPTWMAHSADDGLTWDPARIIYDPGAGNQTFNNQPLVLADGSVVDIFTQPNGFFGQLMAIRSTDHGATWPATGAAVVIANMTPVGTQNPISGGHMAQTAVDATSAKLAAVWQESSFSGGARDGIALSLSADGGATWSAPVQVNTAPAVAAFDPSVHFGSAGRIAVTYYDFRDYVAGSSILSTSLWLRESADGGKSWTETRLYGPFNLNTAPPADQQSGSTGNALFLGDQQALAWNGAAWSALFSGTDAQGAQVFCAIAP